MISQELLEVASGIAPNVQDWPRRVPGHLIVSDKNFRYADMHSFYYQTLQIFGERLYDFHGGGVAPVIIDCGAHIGLASLFFKECYPDARIYAFEADAALAEVARANFEAFGASDIDIQGAAIWTHNGVVSFSLSQDDMGHVCEGGTTVPSVRLKTLLDKGPVEMLKLDVEGAEFDLIEDCGESLRNVRRMIIEVHAHKARAPIAKLLSTLEENDFQYTLGDLQPATWIQSDVNPPFGACCTDKYIFTVFAWR
ncbi:MAG: FkbM family methyltransferase [Luteolibacter sp.]